MAVVFNPFIGDFDYVGQAPFGTLGHPFPATGFYMYDTAGILYLVTIDHATGALTTAVVSSGGTSGSPYGLLLALTQP